MVRVGNIVADERGLAWGPEFARHIARWDEVRAYYDQDYYGTYPPRKFAVTRWQRVVETEAGTLTFAEGSGLSENWLRAEKRLRAYIAEHATSAGIRRWGETRRKADDWPSIYRFDTIITKEALRRMRHWPWRGWLLTPAGVFFLGKLAVPLTARWIYYREGPFRGTSVRAHMDGLTFTDGDARTEVAWTDITDFYRRGRRCVVVTARGECGFYSALDPGVSLRTIIRRYAVNAQAADWRGKSRRKAAQGAGGPWYSEAE